MSRAPARSTRRFRVSEASSTEQRSQQNISEKRMAASLSSRGQGKRARRITLCHRSAAKLGRRHCSESSLPLAMRLQPTPRALLGTPEWSMWGIPLLSPGPGRCVERDRSSSAQAIPASGRTTTLASRVVTARILLCRTRAEGGGAGPFLSGGIPSRVARRNAEGRSPMPSELTFSTLPEPCQGRLAPAVH